MTEGKYTLTLRCDCATCRARREELHTDADITYTADGANARAACFAAARKAGWTFTRNRKFAYLHGHKRNIVFEMETMKDKSFALEASDAHGVLEE